MSNSLLDLPIATIEKALAIRKQIEALQASVDEILGGVKASVTPATVSVTTKKDGRKGKRSAATLAKMAAAAKARWAKVKGATPAAVKSTANGAKKTRKMSPEGRARIIAAVKARWAKKRGQAPAAVAKAPKKKRTMSPEARARIAAAQRARWAKQKAA